MWETLGTAIAAVFNFSALLWISIGTVLGIVVGALPGLTATMGIAIMLPLCITLGPELGMATLL